MFTASSLVGHVNDCFIRLKHRAIKFVREDAGNTTSGVNLRSTRKK